MKDEALKLAIGALGCIEYGPIGIENGPSEDTTEFTITALREALAEQSAQELHEYDWSMLEAAKESLREHMARIKELEAALKQALEALETSTDWNVNATGRQLKSMQAITALRTRLAQPPLPVQPQREWVGLTAEERQDIALEVPMDAVFITEAKLKEKNNGT